MNPVLILTHNCLELTKRCVESVQGQDCGDIVIHLIDNGSTDGTYEWAKSSIPFPRSLLQFDPQIGVSAGWNVGLKNIFENDGEDYALVINNDIVLPPMFLSALVESGEKFITGRSVEPGSDLFWSCGSQQPLNLRDKTPAPDFSAYLISREVWEKVGPFDERMNLYAQDCDYHVRMHRAGIWAGSIPLHFEHRRSSTLNSAPSAEQLVIRQQADRDRQAFQEKWACMPGTWQYSRLFEEVGA